MYALNATANTKYLYNICTMLVDVLQMLYKCSVFAGALAFKNDANICAKT